MKLPLLDVQAEVTLYESAAPTVCRAIYDALAEPVQTTTSHACFDGHEVFCFLPAFPTPPPLENATMRPKPGEVMFFYAPPNRLACLADDRLTGGPTSLHELAFMYGDVDLRHFWEDGLHGSLVGIIDRGLEDFAAACAETLSSGRTDMHLSRVEP